MTKEFLFKKKYIKWHKWGLLTICLILAMSAAIFFAIKQTGFLHKTEQDFSYNADAPVVSKELPSLTIFHVGSRAVGGTAGGSGLTEYATSEHSNTNPWTESSKLSTLPVFRNPLEYDEHVEVTNADYDTMKAYLLHAARSLGLNTRRLEIEDMGHGFLQAKAKDLSINVHPNLTISILPHYKSEMPAGIPLPKKYNLSPKASYEDNQKTAAYLRKKYRKLINMKKSKVKIDNFDFRNNNVIWFYEADGNLTEQIINYNFNNIRFSGYENGNIGGIRIYQYDLSQKIGDYPAISLEEAKKLLVDGYYYGGNAPNYWSGPGDIPKSFFPGLEYVQKVELLYLPSHSHNIYIPFYAFYVDSCYYVPAIEPRYITNMPVVGEFPEVE